MSNRLLIVFFLVLSPYGCGVAPKTPQEKKDPAISAFEDVFKHEKDAWVNGIADRNKEALDEYKKAEEKGEGGGYFQEKFISCTYDVRKTDSLVAPMMGVIEGTWDLQWFPDTKTNEASDSKRRVTRSIYDFKEGKWVLRDDVK